VAALSVSELGGGGRPAAGPPPGLEPAESAPGERLGRLAAGRLLARHPTLVVGATVLAVVLLAGALAPLWWTGDPLQMTPA